MSRTFRVAVAGLGFGAAVHVPAFRSLAGIDIVALAGASTERAKEIADTLGVAEGVGGYENLLDYHPDAVSIALPPKENAAAAEFFLRRGIPILCEKPIASNVESAWRLVELSRQITHAVDFQFAELQAFRSAKSEIESGRIGCVRHIQITWLVESFANLHQLKTWKRSSEGAGGVLFLLASHTFYLMGWLVSSISKMSTRLSTAGELWKNGNNIPPDTFQCWAELKSGTCASIIISNASPEMHVHRWELIGDKGSIILENRSSDYMGNFEMIVLDRRGQYSLEVQKNSESEDGRIVAFASLANRFISAVKANVLTYPSFADGLRVQLEIDASLKSNDGRKIVSIPTELKQV